MAPWFRGIEDYYALHAYEIKVALVFAVIFGLLFEFVKPASLVRALIRKTKNKLAERSIARLRERIANQELYRANMASLSTERGLFLLVLKLILFALLFFALAGVAFVVSETIPRPELAIVVIAFLVGGGGTCIFAMRIASLDTRAKADDFLKKLDQEIADLKATLATRTR